MLNVDWCLLFNLLPQLRWHIVIDQRPYTTAEPKTPMCVHCFNLSRCFYCLGYTAHHEATNTASQPGGECLSNYCFFIFVILFTVLSCFLYYSLQAVHLFYAFINCCKITCNTSFFKHHYVHTMHWFRLYLYQLIELEFKHVFSNTAHVSLFFI